MKKLLLLIAAFAALHTGAQPTWAQDVAPILYSRCTSCHHTGGIAPFALTTYTDAFTYGSTIYNSVNNGSMPPWPPDPNYQRYAHERVLTQTEINTIKDWFNSGKAQGDMSTAPAVPVYNNNTQLGTVDLSVKIPTYTVGSNNDVYRNFPIPSGLLQSKNIIAFEVIPGNPKIVHHVLLFHDSTNVPAQMDANDAGPGYTNVGGTGSNASILIGGYTPGASPYYTPVGTGFRLAANTNIVVQVHYPAGSLGLVDSTRINFKLSTASLRQISVAPILNHYTNITPSPLSIPANQVKTFTESQFIPAKFTVLSALPHMHLIGSSIKSWANKPSTNDTIPFLNIPKWDFHWQDTYVFPNSVIIPTGSTLRAVATFDNTSSNFHNPSSPPKTVSAGESTFDEMMMVFFAYMPYQTGDENIIIDRRVMPQGATTFCNGQSVVLKTIEGTGYTYQWYRNGAILNGNTSFSYKATQAGNYHVVISLGGNTAYSDTIAVNITASPNATITPSGSTDVCPGNNVTLQAATGSGYTYQWFNGTTPIANATSSSYSTSATGDYKVQVYNGCYATSTPVTVTTRTNPTASITAQGATEICPGGSVTLSAPAGNTYLWSNGATTQTISATQVTTYTVTVSNQYQCSASASQAVTLGSSPAVNVTASGNLTFCQGNSVNLTGPANAAYNWSTGANTQSITVTQAGSYTLTITDANNCSGASTAKVVTVNGLPGSTITPAGTTAFCAGGSVNLSAPAGLSYNWSTGATTQTIPANQNTTYSVTVTDGNNCSSSSTQAVTVHPTPSALISTDKPTTICAGDTITLSAPAGLSYAWSNTSTAQSLKVWQNSTLELTVTDNNNCTAQSAITVTVSNNAVAGITPSGVTSFCAGGDVTLTASAGSSYLWNTGATSASINVNTSGSYTVTVTMSANCTAISNPLNVVVNDNPATPVITATGNTTICEGNEVTLTAPAGYNYTWSNTQNVQSINASLAGNYTVTVTDANGCTAAAQAVTLVVNPLPTPTITAGGATVFCQGGSVTLNGSTAGNYLWSNGAITKDITVNTAGTYTLTVTDANNCSNTVSKTVTVHNLPDATVTNNKPTSICPGDSVTLSAPAGLNYQWSDNSTTQSITVSQSGSFAVTVTDNNSCSAVSSAISVTVSNNATAAIATVGSTTFCMGDSVILSASPGVSYLWSTGATSAFITVTDAGSYTVSVTVSGTCTAVANPVSVTVNALPQVELNGNANEICDNATAIQLTGGIPAGGTYAGDGVTGTTFSPAAAGTGNAFISYTYTDGNGCTNTATELILVELCTGIKDVSASAITVYPNPSNGRFTLDLSNWKSQVFTVKVMSLAGQLIYHNKLNGGIKSDIQLPEVTAGTYIIEVKGTGALHRTRMLIER